MIFFLFILGLVIGSFLNVLIDRLPRNEGVLKGRSYCEKCKKNLLWYDLVPLLSFILLKGKCRYCKSPISFYYPLVEFITGFLFVIVYLSNFQLSILPTSLFELRGASNFQLFIVSSLIVVFFTDLKYGIIPNKIIYPAVLVTFIFVIINHKSLFINHFFASFAGFLFFLVLFLATKGKGMGFGDVKLSFLMGLILGFPNIIVALYVAFLTGAVVSLILILWRKKRLKQTIPFGPFLVLGTLVGMFWGGFLIPQLFSFLVGN